MSAAIPGAGVSGVQMTFILDFEQLRLEYIEEAFPDQFNPFLIQLNNSQFNSLSRLEWRSMSEFIEIHPQNPQPRLVREVAGLIEAGGIVAYPTDSSYAFGWAMGDKLSQERIRRLKDLDKHHHFTLVCAGLSELSTYARVDNQAYRLLKALTPGPYTFILPATRLVPNRLQHAKRKSIGIRVPNHAIALAILAELPEPLMSTTLQLPGQEHPMNEAWEIQEALEHELVAIVDGGPCAREATTVIDLTGPVPVVTRAGLGDVSHLRSA